MTFLVVGQLGSFLPAVPGEEVRAQPLVAVAALAAVLGAAGLAGLRARDIG